MRADREGLAVGEQGERAARPPPACRFCRRTRTGPRARVPPARERRADAVQSHESVVVIEDNWPPWSAYSAQPPTRAALRDEHAGMIATGERAPAAVTVNDRL